MKAVLVVDDMPQNCQKCFACINIQNFMAMCVACGEKLKISELDIRPSYCPLKPMPEKSDYELKDDHAYSKAEILAYTYGLTVGRNLVIDEILGDTE